MDKILKNIHCESENIPYIVEHGTLHTPDKEINLNLLLSEKSDDNIDIENVFCVANGKVYFLYGSIEWKLASLDLSTEEFEIYCSFSDGETIYNSFSKCLYEDGKYLTDLFAEYSKRHSYYLDGKIVLNNYTNVLVFDVSSETYEEIPSEEYSFPEYSPLCKVEYVDGEQKLTLFSDSGERAFTLSDMAKTSDGIATIYSFKDYPTWEDSFSCLGTFFSPISICAIDGNIYAIGILKNYGGEGHIVLLEYNEQGDAWKHVKNFYYWEYLHGYAYCIPNLDLIPE